MLHSKGIFDVQKLLEIQIHSKPQFKWNAGVSNVELPYYWLCQAGNVDLVAVVPIMCIAQTFLYSFYRQLRVHSAARHLDIPSIFSLLFILLWILSEGSLAMIPYDMVLTPLSYSVYAYCT